MIAVIPARGGSKGVPQKNIRLLSGRPLIEYTIAAAKESCLFEKIVVSTDSEQIAAVAVQAGAEVPFLRPMEISGDSASSDDAVLHALDFYEKRGEYFDKVCKLQPTSPLRRANHIIDAYKLMHDKKATFLVSICECEHSPLWCGTIDMETLRMDEFIREEAKRACRQELPQYYRLNGAIYMGWTDAYKENRSFLGKNCVGYIMSQEESVDIDTSLDFSFAELIMKQK
ncbi:MAG: acylneuraminate cytidylyltransferase family protein [bacterium]|nr:acylneuraminate cytidylyltransferase family protein [bacterium]MCM1374864.1 acylneuraminate cytidylyltransferase family protein [Muribaculum sp.]